ncbi:metallophosphoesterase family protein [Chitinophaga sp. Hz27]|uniref:metallophosphoesterase family protein n=1 Tax=Chitinophaga sp. Hz27 TaxID=3347169 RepID=UPI0035E1FB96
MSIISRTIALGDIHGGLKALQQLVDGLKITSSDRIVFLGDYVDGWSQSAQVIDFLMRLEQSANCIFIKGNHDVLCESWLNGRLLKEEWLYGHGASTVKSYAGYSEARRMVHLDFFRRMQYFYVDDQQRLFVHGGFTAADGPAYEPTPDLLTKDRTLLELAITMNKRIAEHPELMPKKLAQFKEIFIGHTPTLNYNSFVPIHACNVWDVDTGAGFYGRLTALDIDAKKIYQSEPLPELYPDEPGRNKYPAW